MRIPRLFLLLLPLCASLATTFAEPASAVVRFVRSSDGVDAGTCVFINSPCATIGYALGQAAASGGDTLWVAGSFTESLTVTKAVDIVGKSALTFPTSWESCVYTGPSTNKCPTLRPPAGAAAFDIAPGAGDTVSIEDFRVKDAVGSEAIRVTDGTLDLLRCEIADNSHPVGNAGGILVANGASALNVDTCVFAGNDADVGGAIFAFEPATVVDSSFTLNVASRGGAIAGISDLSVSGSTFQQNFATEWGGAVLVSIGSTSIASSTFTANAALVKGGAVFLDSQNPFSIDTSQFTLNRVDATSGTAFGAAILIEDATGSIDQVDVSSNTLASTTGAGLRGAGIAITSASDVAITQSTIADNETDSTANANSGAGIWVDDSSAGLYESVVRNNEPSGGIVIQDSSAVIEDSTIDAHGGLGGLVVSALNSGGTTQVDTRRSTLSDNVFGINAESLGDPLSFTVVNSTLSGNLIAGRASGATASLEMTASTVAGGLLSTSFGSTLTVSDSIISGSCNGVTLVDANVWDDPSCGVGAVSDVGIGPLLDNGGPTLTHAPLVTSPALEAGALRCLTAPIDAEDQRGQSRPEGLFCDLGAVELPEPSAALGLGAGSLLLARLSRRRGQSRSAAKPT